MLALVASAPADVSCGGHRASSCAGCPQSRGALWCNGDCAWQGGQCSPKQSLPLCRAPACDSDWGNDGFRGYDCAAYGCRTRPKGIMSKGSRGIICRCGNATLLKIARPGHECALGDEWSSMLKVLHLPCFAKPVFGAFSPRADKAPSHIIRALRLFTLREERHRLRVHAKPGRCWTSPFLWRKLAEPATCDRVSDILSAGAALLAGHDSHLPNFLIPTVTRPSCGGEAGRKTNQGERPFDAGGTRSERSCVPGLGEAWPEWGCPIFLADIGQFEWAKAPRNQSRCGAANAGATSAGVGGEGEAGAAAAISASASSTASSWPRRWVEQRPVRVNSPWFMEATASPQQVLRTASWLRPNCVQLQEALPCTLLGGRCRLPRNRSLCPEGRGRQHGAYRRRRGGRRRKPELRDLEDIKNRSDYGALWASLSRSRLTRLYDALRLV